MVGRDRTSDFRNNFDAATKALTPVELDKRRLAFRRLRPARRPVNPFQDLLTLVETNASTAILEARQSIIRAMTLLDDITASSGMREVAGEQLMISDVALQAVGASVKQLQTKVEDGEKTLAKRASGGEGRQLMEHTFNALSILGERVGRRRVAVAVTREEVDRHRTFLVKVSKAGVLAWPGSGAAVPTKASILRSRGDERSLKAADTTKAEATAKPTSDQPSNRVKAASAVATLANVTSAGVLALTRNVTGKGSATVTQQSDAEAKRQRSLRQAAELDAAVHNMDSARRTALELEQQQLHRQQQQSSAAAAKEVEATVRDLSILTAILNEQVALQAEKLVLVERDTSASQNNLAKAASELQKPAQEMWTPDRMLAAVLMACSLLLLLLNAIIR